MLLAEGVFLCALFWGVCWLGTGSDVKNIRNFSSYPDAVQKIVILRPELAGKIRQRGSCGRLCKQSASVYGTPVCPGTYYSPGDFYRKFFECLAFRADAEFV